MNPPTAPESSSVGSCPARAVGREVSQGPSRLRRSCPASHFWHLYINAIRAEAPLFPLPRPQCWARERASVNARGCGWRCEPASFFFPQIYCRCSAGLYTGHRPNVLSHEPQEDSDHGSHSLLGERSRVQLRAGVILASSSTAWARGCGGRTARRPTRLPHTMCVSIAGEGDARTDTARGVLAAERGEHLQ